LKKKKREGEELGEAMTLTPIIIISAKHPEHLKDIKKISKKWEKLTKKCPRPGQKEALLMWLPAKI